MYLPDNIDDITLESMDDRKLMSLTQNGSKRAYEILIILSIDSSLYDGLYGSQQEERGAAAEQARLQSPEEVFLEKEYWHQVSSWMQELKKEYRQALYLFCIEEKSYEEIARLMGKSKAQVKMYIFRARKKILDKRREMQ